ncbi:6,7-dimethyl-8-ribityllumazine synthase [Rapidithrix thailandica]|uniref:6,7-dimethyl-8-ribityllumazine synthase n=1 Tax=Rapidithrix thailandica TaxID=413964 RepID=A0AAW9RYE9_9BACT
MATSLKNLSDYQIKKQVDLSDKKFALVVSEYNENITGALFQEAFHTLVKEGAKEENIEVHTVPGAYELTFGAQRAAKKEDIDAVICLGCVIQGDTKHFDFICDAVAHGITQVSLKFDKPVIFGVLTPNTLQQALDRAGGKHGNKGVEAAVAAIKMLEE